MMTAKHDVREMTTHELQMAKEDDDQMQHKWQHHVQTTHITTWNKMKIPDSIQKAKADAPQMILTQHNKDAAQMKTSYLKNHV
jgi:hypothetical protein